MNIRSMHIEVQQSLQQVAANRNRKYLDEEIDWVLNKMIERFVQSRLRPRADAQGRPTGGFELDQLQADSIRFLLKTRTLTPYIQDSERYKCFLPPDYKFLISDSAWTTDLCGSTPEVTAQSLYLYKLSHDKTTKASAPYYETLEVVTPTGTAEIPAHLPPNHNYTGLLHPLDYSFLVPWIALKTSSYWERFGDLYHPGCYLSVHTASGGTVTLAQDGTSTIAGTELEIPLTRHAGTGTRRPSRLSPSHIIANLNAAPHYRTAHYSPISELEGEKLLVYTDGSFTVNKVEVTYVRKCQPVSLSLNMDCELAPEFHPQICDLAVEYIKGDTQDTLGRQLKQTDLAERVIL